MASSQIILTAAEAKDYGLVDTVIRDSEDISATKEFRSWDFLVPSEELL